MIGKIVNGGLLKGRKTFLTGIGTLVAAVIAYLTGEMSLAELVPSIGVALGLVGLRFGFINEIEKFFGAVQNQSVPGPNPNAPASEDDQPSSE